MTLIVAVCLEEKRTREESVLIFSDSQATAGLVSYSVHKIAQIWADKGPIAMAAGSGDGAMVKKAVDLSASILQRKAIEEWEEETPSFGQFHEAIQEIEKELICSIAEYEAMGVDVNFDFLLASVSPDGESSLYLFDERGVVHSVHDNPKFACIGSGFVLGGNLLLQQFYSPDLTLDEASRLLAYVINEVSKVDAGVGPFEGEGCHFRLEDKKPALGSITSSGLREVRRDYERRKKLLRYIWEQCDKLGPKELRDAIRKALKKPKKKKAKGSKTVKRTRKQTGRK